MISLRGRLLLWSLGALGVGAVLIALATFAISLRQMNEVLDGELRQSALTLLSHYQAGRPADPAAPTGGADPDLDSLALATQVWTLDGRRIFASQPSLELPMARIQGFETVVTRHGPWRVYTDRSAHYLIQAAQAMAVRQRVAAAVALRSLVPSLAAVPLLALLLAGALQRGLRPLRRAADAVRQRSATSLEPVEIAALPGEVRPLLESINALLAQLDRALSAQRRFTADAAHELRTPLAALRLQLQIVGSSHDAASRADALDDAARGLARATRLVEQLLQLSRLGPDAPPPRRERVDLAALARSVVADFSRRADALGIDLGVEAGPVAASASGDAEQLRVMLNNLVDNALRHTPRRGRVDLRLRDAGRRVAIEVADSGAGLPDDERERVFRRFYRADDGSCGPGTGLGLSIVRAVVSSHGGRIELADGLSNAEGGRGLAVRITLMRAEPGAEAARRTEYHRCDLERG